MKLNYLLIPLITIMVALIGSALTELGLNKWYKSLKRPWFTPPGSQIGIIWTIIFILAAISALLVWNSSLSQADDLIILGYMFLLNAIMNIFWSFLFFYAHMLSYAAIEAAALALSVLALMFYIYSISVIATLLLLPYFIWTCFATYLTFSIWQLNKE